MLEVSGKLVQASFIHISFGSWESETFYQLCSEECLYLTKPCHQPSEIMFFAGLIVKV